MNKARKYFMWYIMSSKRLLKKLSFVILLLLIPALIPVTNGMMEGESGVVKIALSSEDSSQISDRIIKSLLDRESIINFKYYNTPQEAEKAVRANGADAAWIFEENFEEKLDLYAKRQEGAKLVKVLEREDNIQMQLSREVLYSAMFRDISYYLYENFTYSNVVSPDQVHQEQLKETYDDFVRNGSVITLWRLGSGEVKEQQNYLTAPLRGLMSLVVVLCTIAAMMYFLSDQKAGKYDWLPAKKRIAPSFALCLSAAVFSAVAVLLALLASGYSTGIINEVLSMLLFVMMATGFAMLLGSLFSSAGTLGAALPGIMIVSLVMSPIFFSFKILRPVRLMLPTYYYLMSVHNVSYYLYGLIYCVVIYGAVFVINHIKKNTSKGSAI